MLIFILFCKKSSKDFEEPFVLGSNIQGIFIKENDEENKHKII